MQNFLRDFKITILNSYPRETNDEFKFKLFPDEVYLTSEQLVKQEDPFLNHFFKIQGLSNASLDRKIESFASINIPDKDDKYLCLPFYNVYRRIVQKEIIHNPQSLPTVPDEYIEKYRYVFDSYCYG